MAGSSNSWPKSKEYRALVAECYGGEHTVEFKDAARRKLVLYKSNLEKGAGYFTASKDAWETTLGEAQQWCREHSKEGVDPDDKFQGCRINTDNFDIVDVFKWTAKALGSTAVRKLDCPGPEYWSNYQWARENTKDFWSAANRIIPTPVGKPQSAEEDEEKLDADELDFLSKG